MWMSIYVYICVYACKYVHTHTYVHAPPNFCCCICYVYASMHVHMYVQIHKDPVWHPDLEAVHAYVASTILMRTYAWTEIQAIHAYVLVSMCVCGCTQRMHTCNRNLNPLVSICVCVRLHTQKMHPCARNLTSLVCTDAHTENAHMHQKSHLSRKHMCVRECAHVPKNSPI